MIAIFCLDDHNGMVFNHRRQSKDKVLLADIMELCNGHMIYMSEYSNIMFRQYKKMVENIKVAPDFLQLASAGDYCFVEDSDIHPYMDRVEKIILYKWNRHYPADHYFDISLLDGWVLNDIVDFKGSSHEKITREVYQNEKKY